MRPLTALAGCGLLATLAAPAARADDLGDRMGALLERQASSIVTVKVVLKTEFQIQGQAQDEEERVTVPGVVVDASGLVMVSNTPISGGRIRDMFEQMLGGQDFELSVTPLEMKVVFEGEEEGVDAFVAASDARLDLAFLQVEDLGDRELTAVDFGADAEVKPGIGAAILAVNRMGEGFDYAPYVEVGRVTGRVKKPRPAWRVSGVTSPGLPVFGSGGETLGVITLIASGVEPEGGGGMFGGFGGEGDEPVVPLLVPAKHVRGVIGQAKTRAAEVAAERAEADAGGEGEGE